jgi:hypothetical protein
LADTAWLAWHGLVAHGWRPAATDGAVTTFVRGHYSSTSPPFSEPPRNDALFCQGWFPPDGLGHQMSASHAALWVYGAGILRLYLASPEPLPVRISVDGRLHSTRVVEGLPPSDIPEGRIGLPGERWHLVALDTGRLPEIRGKPRGARIVAYVLPQR